MQLVPTGLTLLYTMTEREADNFGIFFREVLSSIKGWWVSPCPTVHKLNQCCAGYACTEMLHASLCSRANLHGPTLSIDVVCQLKQHT